MIASCPIGWFAIFEIEAKKHALPVAAWHEYPSPPGMAVGGLIATPGSEDIAPGFKSLFKDARRSSLVLADSLPGFLHYELSPVAVPAQFIVNGAPSPIAPRYYGPITRRDR